MIRPENLSTVYCKLALSCPWHCVSIGALDLRIYTLDLLHSGWGISYCRPWIVSWLFYSLDRVLHWLFTVLAVLYRDFCSSHTGVWLILIEGRQPYGRVQGEMVPPTNTPNTHAHILYMINIHVFILRPKQMPAYMWIYVLDAWQLTFTDYILYIIYTVIENDFWQFPSLKFSFCFSSVSITTIVPVSVVSGWRRLCLWWAR